MNVSLRLATPDDVKPIALHLREADRRELGYKKRGAKDALREGMKLGTAGVLEVDGKPAAMFGIVPNPAFKDQAGIWMLGTDLVDKVPLSLCRAAKAFVESQQAIFTTLYNWVSADNTKAIEWLKWLGFTVEPDPMDINGHPFHYFHKEAAPCATQLTLASQSP